MRKRDRQPSGLLLVGECASGPWPAGRQLGPDQRNVAQAPGRWRQRQSVAGHVGRSGVTSASGPTAERGRPSRRRTRRLFLAVRRMENTTMAEGQSMTVADVVAKTMDGRFEDFVREAVALVVRELMEAEVSVEVG